jgi:hypothetical protein
MPNPEATALLSVNTPIDVAWAFALPRIPLLVAEARAAEKNPIAVASASLLLNGVPIAVAIARVNGVPPVIASAQFIPNSGGGGAMAMSMPGPLLNEWGTMHGSAYTVLAPPELSEKDSSTAATATTTARDARRTLPFCRSN